MISRELRRLDEGILGMVCIHTFRSFASFLVSHGKNSTVLRSRDTAQTGTHSQMFSCRGTRETYFWLVSCRKKAEYMSRTLSRIHTSHTGCRSPQSCLCVCPYDILRHQHCHWSTIRNFQLWGEENQGYATGTNYSPRLIRESPEMPFWPERKKRDYAVVRQTLLPPRDVATEYLLEETNSGLAMTGGGDGMQILIILAAYESLTAMHPCDTLM